MKSIFQAKMYLLVFVISGIIGSVSSALTKPGGCGSTKGCYTDCNDGPCTFAVTWAENGDNVDFSLQYKLPGSGNYWIALGLSHDTEMGDDSVTDCIMENSAVHVFKSYNLIGTDLNEAFSTAERQMGLSATSGSVSNGVLTCSYTQSKTTSHPRIKDLNTDRYLLVATGKASYGVKLQHSVSPLPAVTPHRVDLQKEEDIGATAKNVLVKIHGCLMMYAWIFAASIGIVLARYYKRMWPNKRHCREKVWFTWHRTVMLSAFFTCIAAFVIIFVELKDWAYLEDSSRWQQAHPYLGVIVTAFCVINPILAFCRPHPDARYRAIFSWFHWLIGQLAHILATITMIIGVTLDKASTPFYVVWILIAFAVYQVMMELFLEIHECCIAGSADKYYRDGTMKDPKGSRLKKICLFIHVLIILGFAAVCIVITAIN